MHCNHPDMNAYCSELGGLMVQSWPEIITIKTVRHSQMIVTNIFQIHLAGNTSLSPTKRYISCEKDLTLEKLACVRFMDQVTVTHSRENGPLYRLHGGIYMCSFISTATRFLSALLFLVNIHEYPSVFWGNLSWFIVMVADAERADANTFIL